MNIEEIKQRLSNLGFGKIVKYDNTMSLATQYALDYKLDVEFLLEQNQRLVEALEIIAEREYYDEKYPMNVARNALQAYKLLEKKEG